MDPSGQGDVPNLLVNPSSDFPISQRENVFISLINKLLEQCDFLHILSSFSSGITGLHDNLFSLSRFVRSSPWCSHGLFSLSAQPPMLSHCPTGFMVYILLSLADVQIVPLLFGGALESLTCRFPSMWSEKDPFSPALGQAVLCKSLRILLDGFTAIPIANWCPFFCLLFCPKKFCLILLLCRYLLVISCWRSGWFFPRNAMLYGESHSISCHISDLFRSFSVLTGVLNAS